MNTGERTCFAGVTCGMSLTVVAWGGAGRLGRLDVRDGVEVLPVRSTPAVNGMYPFLVNQCSAGFMACCE